MLTTPSEQIIKKVTLKIVNILDILNSIRRNQKTKCRNKSQADQDKMVAIKEAHKKVANMLKDSDQTEFQEEFQKVQQGKIKI